MKNTFSWISGAFCYLLLAIFLSAYDNAEMHPAINAPMVDAFLDRFVNNPARPADLKGYDFAFDGYLVFEGPAVTASGYFASTIGVGMQSKNVKEWLMHGGYSADEPQVPAALRHFYDPLGIDNGKTWLTDRGTYWEWIVNNNALNPSIDAKTWALDHPENPWTWEKGKEWMRKALAEEVESRRDEHLARAWRCLGEALHMIADMGCPSHVRNDSHAAPLGWRYRLALGDPDPYEELVQTAFVEKYARGAVDPGLKSDFRTAERAETIFENMALFTNENFFTSQTISGRGAEEYAPLIEDRPAYPSPRLEAMTYDTRTATFLKSFPGGQVVRMCKDEGYFLQRTYPYIDAACVESQSSVLIPNIIEAGANLLRLFIPKLDLQITSAGSDGVVEGTITLKSNEEYIGTSTIVGRIYLLVDSSPVGEGDLRSDGSFRISELTLEKGDKVVAEYRIGGMYIRSEPFTVDDTGRLEQLLKARWVRVEFWGTHTFTNAVRKSNVGYGVTHEPSIGMENFGITPIVWNGRNFSMERDYANAELQFTETTSITGSVSADGNTVTSLRVTSSSRNRNKIEQENMEFRDLRYMMSIPVLPVLPTDDLDYGNKGPAVEQLFVSRTYSFRDVDVHGSPVSYEYINTLWSTGTPRIEVKFFR